MPGRRQDGPQIAARTVFTKRTGWLTRLRWMGPMAVCTCAVLLTIFGPGLAVSLAIFALSGTFAVYQLAANIALAEWVLNTHRPGVRPGQHGVVVGQSGVLMLADAAAEVRPRPR